MKAGREAFPSHRLAVAAGLTAVLGIAGGCSFAPAPETPATVSDLPPSYGDSAAPEPYVAERWWRTFADSTLDRLILAALEANLDLGEAASRLEELRHRYRIARAALVPSLSLTADVTRSSSPANTGLGGQFGGGDGEGEGEGEPAPDSTAGPAFTLPDRFDFTTYTASLGFAYELDFWGRARNASRAGLHEYLASRADLHTVRLGVIGGTVSTYFEIVSLREQLALAEENVELLAERAEVTEERYRRGLVGSFELYTIREQYRSAQAELPLARARLDDAEARLAVLLGRYAGRLGELLPERLEPRVALAPIPAGLPVRLLEGRPDVVAAFARLEAARHRVGVERAELLPTISLNGSVGFQASEPENLFRADQWFLSLVGGLFAPLFQAGRLRAEAGAAEAQHRQLIAAFVRTVLTAYAEVRTSLRRFDHERDRHALALSRLDEARASLALQLDRFRRGVGDYVSYLDARRNLVGAEIARSESERGLAEARLAVHRALGGAWVSEEEAATAGAGGGVDASAAREGGAASPPDPDGSDE